ncbi:MspA family porin [Rhodococcus sp. NPDC003322]
MTEIRRARRSQQASTSGGHRRTHSKKALAVAGVAALGLTLGTGTAGAVVNNASSIIDAQNNTIEVSQGDTQITSVPPLDSSPLSREFFHSGYAEARITGPGADAMEGSKLSFGYQVGYPIALTGATIQLNTPALGFEVEGTNGLALTNLLTAPDLDLAVGGRAELLGDIIPQQNFTFDLQPGGITDVPIVDAKEFSGPGAKIRISGVHGSVSGAIGPVTLRPYARLETASGDIVMTYGAPVPV